MQIMVNGEQLEAVDKCTIAALLAQLQIGRERVAVEVNQEIVPKLKYDEHHLAAGDRIEIVQFVGGG